MRPWSIGWGAISIMSGRAGEGVPAPLFLLFYSETLVLGPPVPISQQGTRHPPSGPTHPEPLGRRAAEPHRSTVHEDSAMTNLNLSQGSLDRLALFAIVVVTLLPLVPYAL